MLLSSHTSTTRPPRLASLRCRLSTRTLVSATPSPSYLEITVSPFATKTCSSFARDLTLLSSSPLAAIWIGNSTKPNDPTYSESANYTSPSSTLPDGWTEVGCIPEPTNARALLAASFTSQDMTVGSCVNYCAGLGLPLAGVEYGTQVSPQLKAVHSITTLTCIWFCFPVLRAFKTFSQPPAQLKLMKTSSTVRQQASKRCDEHGDRLFGPVQRQVLGSQHGELWRREQAHSLRQPRLRLDRSHPSLWMGLLVVHDGGFQRPCAFGRYDL